MRQVNGVNDCVLDPFTTNQYLEQLLQKYNNLRKVDKSQPVVSDLEGGYQKLEDDDVEEAPGRNKRRVVIPFAAIVLLVILVGFVIYTPKYSS